jgi:hypothetical protein
MISNITVTITIAAVASSRKEKESENGMLPSFRHCISHERDVKMLSMASLRVYSASPVAGGRFCLTVFNDDHDLVRASARMIRHPERPKAK